MNLSGKPTLKIIEKYGSRDLAYLQNNFLLVLDDLENKMGKFRIKKGGSPNGHNGTKGFKYYYTTWNFYLNHFMFLKI